MEIAEFLQDIGRGHGDGARGTPSAHVLDYESRVWAARQDANVALGSMASMKSE